MKIIRIFHLKIFIFLVVKISVYLNRHVFVMGFKDVRATKVQQYLYTVMVCLPFRLVSLVGNVPLLWLFLDLLLYYCSNATCFQLIPCLYCSAVAKAPEMRNYKCRYYIESVLRIAFLSFLRRHEFPFINGRYIIHTINNRARLFKASLA